MKLVAVLLFGFALPACAHMEKGRGHDSVSHLVESRSGHRTGWEQGSPEARQIQERVNALLKGGLNRERAVQIALINNPHLQETYDELDVSQADLVQAGLLSNPTLSGSIGFQLGHASGRPEYEVSIVQSFLDIFMLPLRKRVAEAQFDADTLRVAHAALQVAAETSKEFVELQTSEQTVELMRNIAASADAAASLAEKQFEAGNINQRAVASERAASAQAELDLAHDQLTVLEHRERLNRLLGLWGANSGWQSAQPLQAIPSSEAPLEHLEVTALKQRLDVEAARKQVEMMDSALSMARTSRYTGLVNVGAHVHQDADGPRLAGPTLSLELPIFDQRQALIGRLEAQRRQAQRRLDALGLDVRSEVRLAKAQLDLNRHAAEQYLNALLPLRRTVLEQSELEYNAMQIGLYELLATKRSEIETFRAYLNTVRDYWLAHAELERALGGRITSPRPGSHQ
ncbi:MAG TPA: TolC family protein [Polyangiaceae bacterium]|nr:TolC family protein [Polyangiaceae bacterium]